MADHGGKQGWRAAFRLLAAALLCLGGALSGADPSPEERAVAYLAREVPLWSRQNHCFSCHNNGDGARALYAARRLSYPLPEEALADTTRWLIRPSQWDHTRGDAGFSDQKLARIQFAASLTEAFAAGLVEDTKVLLEAAESLLPHQSADGSWAVDGKVAVGSPATYGSWLATYLARRTLERSGHARFQDAIARADHWFLEKPVSSQLDAAATVLALADRRSAKAESKLKDSLEMLVRGQTSEGGWGPYLNSPPEPFDTAVVLLAFGSLPPRSEIPARIERGRAYLARTQLPSGGWPETTRPPGAQSYAQHISTAGWATLALLETRSVGTFRRQDSKR